MEQSLNHLTSRTSRKLFDVLNPLPPQTIITKAFILKEVKATTPIIHDIIKLFISKGWLVRICRGGYMKAGKIKNLNN